MMIDSKDYIESIKDEPLEELLKERDEFIKEMHEFENKEKEDLDDIVITCPSPETQYQFSFLYLAELCKVISERLND